MIKKYGSAHLFILVQVGFIALYIIAYFYRLERIQYEAAGELFNVVNSQSFFILERGRLAVGLSQVLAVLAVRFNLPLDTVISAYSFNHILFFHLSSLIAFYFKNPIGAALALIIPFSGTDSTFFLWPYAELLYGIGLIIIWDSVNLRPDRIRLFWPITILLCVLIVSSHVLAFYLFLCLLAWRVVSNQYTHNYSILPIVIVIFGCWTVYFESRPYQLVSSPSSILNFDTIEQQFFLSLSVLFSDPVTYFILSFSALMVLLGRQKNTLLIFLLFVFVLHGLILIALPGQGRTDFYRSTITVSSLFVLASLKWHHSIASLKPILVGLFFGFLVIITVEKVDTYKLRTEHLFSFVQNTSKLNHGAFIVTKNSGFFRQFPDLDYFLQPETVLFSCLSGCPVSIVAAKYLIPTYNQLGAHFLSNQFDKSADFASEILIRSCKEQHQLNYECHDLLNARYFNIDSRFYAPLAVGASGNLYVAE